VNVDTTQFITFKMLPTLNEFHNDSDVEIFTKKIERMNLKDDVKVTGYSLRVSADIVHSWFQYSIDKTVGHIEFVETVWPSKSALFIYVLTHWVKHLNSLTTIDTLS